MKTFNWKCGELPELPEKGQEVILYPSNLNKMQYYHGNSYLNGTLIIDSENIKKHIYVYMGFEVRTFKTFRKKQQLKISAPYNVYIFESKYNNNKRLTKSKTNLRNQYNNWEVFDQNKMMAFL